MSDHSNGYRGIWFTLDPFSAYGDKYSGGLGTYTAKHVPMAIHAAEAKKTFFVYGGARCCGAWEAGRGIFRARRTVTRAMGYVPYDACELHGRLQ
ncbi:MAG: hypothetical protein ACOC3G_03905 [Phycisphaeraceae bacterium]